MSPLRNPAEAWAELCDRLDQQNTLLEQALHSLQRSEQEHSRQLREWEPFAIWDGAVTASNAATVGGGQSNLVPAPRGWEARVHRIVITVGGASNGATATLYKGSADTVSIFDFADQFYIGSPSVNASDYASPVVFLDGQAITVAVASTAAGSNGVTVRVEGFRRQV